MRLELLLLHPSHSITDDDSRAAADGAGSDGKCGNGTMPAAASPTLALAAAGGATGRPHPTQKATVRRGSSS